MDDELQQLEAELRRLRPAATSRRLVASIDREIASAPVARRPVAPNWFWAGALPAAAALAVMAAVVMRRDVSGQHRSQSTGSGAADVLKPVEVENVLYSARDEGLVTLGDGTEARRERLNFVDTITWRNPRTNASLKWSVPREEVRVVPVSFQ